MITILVLFVTTLFFLFMFVDNLPWSMIICGLVSQVLHAIILTDFPYVKPLSVQFVGTIILLFVNHFLAFKHFTLQYYSFTEVTDEMLDSNFVAIFQFNFQFVSGTRLFYNMFMDRSICPVRVVKCKWQRPANGQWADNTVE